MDARRTLLKTLAYAKKRCHHLYTQVYRTSGWAQRGGVSTDAMARPQCGGAHKQSLSKSTTPLSPGRRGGATARSALGWYRPSVGVPRGVGCRSGNKCGEQFSSHLAVEQSNQTPRHCAMAVHLPQSVASALARLLFGGLLRLGRPRPPLGDVGLEVKLALAPGVVHEADLAKDGALGPAHVVRA